MTQGSVSQFSFYCRKFRHFTTFHISPLGLKNMSYWEIRNWGERMKTLKGLKFGGGRKREGRLPLTGIGGHRLLKGRLKATRPNLAHHLVWEPPSEMIVYTGELHWASSVCPEQWKPALSLNLLPRAPPRPSHPGQANTEWTKRQFCPAHLGG